MMAELISTSATVSLNWLKSIRIAELSGRNSEKGNSKGSSRYLDVRYSVTKLKIISFTSFHATTPCHFPYPDYSLTAFLPMVTAVLYIHGALHSLQHDSSYNYNSYTLLQSLLLQLLTLAVQSLRSCTVLFFLTIHHYLYHTFYATTVAPRECTLGRHTNLLNSSSVVLRTRPLTRLIRSSKQTPVVRLLTGSSDTDGILRQLRLLERNAQGLGTHRGSLIVSLVVGVHGSSRVVLDPLLGLNRGGPGSKHQVTGVQSLDKVVPGGGLDDVLVQSLLGLVEQVLLDGLEQLRNSSLEIGNLQHNLLSGVSSHSHNLALLDISRSDLDSQRNTSQLGVRELPAGRVSISGIRSNSDVNVSQSLLNIGSGVHNGSSLLSSQLGSQSTGDDDGLGVGHSRGENQTLVVRVSHGHDTNDSGGQTPGVLPGEELVGSSVGILHGNVKHLGKVLTQAMGGGSLDTSTSGRNETLNGGGEQSTGKLLLLGLLTLDDGHSQQLAVDLLVVVENGHDLVLGLLEGQVSSVALLPQELSSSQEGLGVLELPSHNRVPLVELERQVSVRSHPLGVVGVHDGLGGGSNGDGLLEVGVTGLGDPRDLRGKTLDVVLLLLQNSGRHKHGEVGVLDAQLLDLDVEPLLDLLPHKVGGGSHDVAAGHVVVVQHLSLGDNLLVPSGEVVLLVDGDSDQHVVVLGLGCFGGHCVSCDSCVLRVFCHFSVLTCETCEI